MRTKTLLLSAAALAAGLVSSFAQSNVYSANIVGYVTYVSQTNAPGFELINTPLDSGTNTLKNLFPSAPGGSQILLWGTSGYNIASYSAVLGHWRTNGITADDTLIPPGSGYFIQISGAAKYTNTFVGSLAAAPGVSITNTIPSGFQLIGSQVPYDGNVTNGAALNLNGVAGGTQVLLWNFTTQQFDIYQWSAVLSAWRLNGISVPLNLNVNQGFFLNAAAPYKWVQTGPQ